MGKNFKNFAGFTTSVGDRPWSCRDLLPVYATGSLAECACLKIISAEKWHTHVMILLTMNQIYCVLCMITLIPQVYCNTLQNFSKAKKNNEMIYSEISIVNIDDYI